MRVPVVTQPWLPGVQGLKSSGRGCSLEQRAHPERTQLRLHEPGREPLNALLTEGRWGATAPRLLLALATPCLLQEPRQGG